ncbi:hypothetical protein AB7M35_003821 [Amorphus suaedae]
MTGSTARLLAAALVCLSVLFSHSASAGRMDGPAVAAEAISGASEVMSDHHGHAPQANFQLPSDHEHSSKMMDGKCSMDCHSVFVSSSGNRVTHPAPAWKTLPAETPVLTGGLTPSDYRPPRA